MSFNNIIGNEKIKSYLQEFINNKAISHSYLFSGQDGIGKNYLQGNLQNDSLLI